MTSNEWFDKEYSAKAAYGRLWNYAKKYRYLLFIGLLAGMVVGGTWVPIFQMVQPALVQMTGNVPVPAEGEGGQVSIHQPDEDDAYPAVMLKVEKVVNRMGYETRDENDKIKNALFIMLGLILPVAFGLKMLGDYVNHYALRKAGAYVVRDLRNDLFDHLQDQSLAFYGRGDVGRLISRCTSDPTVIENVVSITVSEICRAPFEIAAALGYVIWFAVSEGIFSLLLTALLVYPACMFPLIYIGRRIRKWSHANLQRSAGVVSVMHENLTCIRIVKAYHTEAHEKRHFHSFTHSVLKSVMRTVRLELLIPPLTQTIAMVLAGFFLLYCYTNGASFFDIIPLVPPFLILYRPLKQLGRIQTAIEKGRAALTRIFSLLDVDTALKEAKNPVAMKDFTSKIRFDNVSFRYGENGDFVVKNADFEIKRGQMFAVVGSTGSGKSTLANLLARFYDATEGQVLIDDTDVRDIAITDIRNLIGVVNQETILFNTTIAENIAYGTPNATREQIVHAAELANAHSFITAHPEGYDRVVGEKGFVLSGGERQRVAIARAILKNPPILVLDEATSALDTVTEQQVQAALTKLMENRTVFAIAHRLSTIRQSDQILVLDKGEIVERGTHDELYTHNGVYRHLCDIQSSQDQVLK